MKTFISYLVFATIASTMFAQNVESITNIETFITQSGSKLETILLHKNSKQYQNPYRKIDFSLIQITNIVNDSIMHGIKLMCITDYLTKQTRVYYSFLDFNEINSLLDWIETVKRTPLLKQDQAFYFIPKKGKCMFCIINNNDRKYFQFIQNKNDLSTAVYFDMEVFNIFEEFLNNVSAAIEK